MSDSTATYPLALVDDPDELDLQGLSVDGDLGLHEEAWAQMEAMAAGYAADYAPRLATVSSVSAGLVYVKIDGEVEARTVGFAHAMGLTFRAGQRCVVQKLAGGEYWVQAAYTVTEGAVEQVVTNKDLATDSVDSRVIVAGAVGTAEILSGAVTGGQGGSLAGATVALANLASDVQTKISASLQVGDVKGGGTWNRNGQGLIHEGWVQGTFNDSNKLITSSALDNYAKDGNGDNAIVRAKQLSDYVKSSQLATGATGKDQLATRDWVQTNFEPKGKKNKE